MWEERLSKISCCCPLTNGAPATNAPLVIQVTNGAPPDGAPLVLLQKKGIKTIIKKITLVAHLLAGAPLLVTTSNGAPPVDAPLVCLDRRTSSKKIWY